MRVRWFGEPWNDTLCEEEHKTDVPVGTECIECGKPIKLTDRGVVTACSTSIWGSWELKDGEDYWSVCSYHLSCFLAVVTGGEIEGTVVEKRAEGACTVELDKIHSPQYQRAIDPDIVHRIAENFDPDLLEDAEAGKGW